MTSSELLHELHAVQMQQYDSQQRTNWVHRMFTHIQDWSILGNLLKSNAFDPYRIEHLLESIDSPTLSERDTLKGWQQAVGEAALTVDWPFGSGSCQHDPEQERIALRWLRCATRAYEGSHHRPEHATLVRWCQTHPWIHDAVLEHNLKFEISPELIQPSAMSQPSMGPRSLTQAVAYTIKAISQPEEHHCHYRFLQTAFPEQMATLTQHVALLWNFQSTWSKQDIQWVVNQTLKGTSIPSEIQMPADIALPS